MEGYDREFWQLSDQLRLHNLSIWSSPPPVAGDHNSNKLAFANAGDRYSSSNNATAKSYFNKSVGRPDVIVDVFDGKKKRQQLPASESVPKEAAIGGYIFVCNKETMEENLRRRLFGLPSRYRDSVRAIRPGLPLFLYNYSTHQLHGIFEAASFGGSNIDPGESRFPAQVRVATRKICEPLEEDAFRPVLHHYDGPKFRLELTVAEAVSLLDIFAEKLFA
uniref:DCD domain-containing protein n=1 Tax=Oryza punctata TaxID=4537 RepID=A0A0E0L6L0_ORYPU